ncbi:unnamed protein product [Amoebophrya sp. A25]|nr:unnamed protein product [Amoebophrya sp. A25]|eukprot:GSA25T00003677001.1
MAARTTYRSMNRMTSRHHAGASYLWTGAFYHLWWAFLGHLQLFHTASEAFGFTRKRMVDQKLVQTPPGCTTAKAKGRAAPNPIMDKAAAKARLLQLSKSVDENEESTTWWTLPDHLQHVFGLDMRPRKGCRSEPDAASIVGARQAKEDAAVKEALAEFQRKKGPRIARELGGGLKNWLSRIAGGGCAETKDDDAKAGTSIIGSHEEFEKWRRQSEESIGKHGHSEEQGTPADDGAAQQKTEGAEASGDPVSDKTPSTTTTPEIADTRKDDEDDSALEREPTTESEVISKTLENLLWDELAEEYHQGTVLGGKTFEETREKVRKQFSRENQLANLKAAREILKKEQAAKNAAAAAAQAAALAQQACAMQMMACYTQQAVAAAAYSSGCMPAPPPYAAPATIFALMPNAGGLGPPPSRPPGGPGPSGKKNNNIRIKGKHQK